MGAGDHRRTDCFGMEGALKTIDFLKQGGLGLKHESCCPRAKTFLSEVDSCRNKQGRLIWGRTVQEKSSCKKGKASRF